MTLYRNVSGNMLERLSFFVENPYYDYEIIDDQSSSLFEIIDNILIKNKILNKKKF